MTLRAMLQGGIRYGTAVGIASTAILSILSLPGFAKTAMLIDRGTTNNIDLLSAPMSRSNTLYYGFWGEQVDVLAQTQDKEGYTWYKVKPTHSGIAGWVRTENVSLQPSGLKPESLPEASIEPAPLQLPPTGVSPVPAASPQPKPTQAIAPVPSPQPTLKPRLAYNPTASGQQQSYTAEQIRYFVEIALGSEFPAAADPIRKWQGEVRVQVLGSPTAEDLKTVNTVMSELNSLTHGTIALRLSNDNPNIRIHFAPISQFKRLEPHYQPENYGFFWTKWTDQDVIYDANILVTSTGVTQKERSHLLREELTQALGLMQDSWRYKDSMFYQGWTDPTQYSAMDKALIQMLYRPEVRPGMSKAQVMKVLSALRG